MVIDGDFTSPTSGSPGCRRLVELKPYFNDGYQLDPLADGLARFQDGKAAMVFASPGYLQMIKAMNKAGKDVGVMKVPPVRQARAGQSPDDGHARLPGDPVRQGQDAGRQLPGLPAYAGPVERPLCQTGDLPNDQRWDTSKVTRATDKQLIELVAQGSHLLLGQLLSDRSRHERQFRHLPGHPGRRHDGGPGGAIPTRTSSPNGAACMRRISRTTVLAEGLQAIGRRHPGGPCTGRRVF